LLQVKIQNPQEYFVYFKGFEAQNCDKRSAVLPGSYFLLWPNLKKLDKNRATPDILSSFVIAITSPPMSGFIITYHKRMSIQRKQCNKRRRIRKFFLPILRSLSIVGLAILRLSGDGIQLALGLPFG